jgi:peroxiredoxin
MRLITLIFIFISFSSFAQNVNISGNIPSYANKEIKVYKKGNFITNDRIDIKSIFVDETGNFNFKYQTSKIERIFLDAGFFNISLFVYPKMNSNIIIPKYKEVPKGDIFFKAVNLPALVDTSDSKELNTLIMTFNKDLALMNDKYYSDIIDKNINIIKTIDKEINNKYPSKNKYFNTYKKYSIGICEFPIYANNSKPFIERYFPAGMQNNDAFIELFNQCFSNILTYNQFKEEKNLTSIKLYNSQMKDLRSFGIKSKQMSQYITLKSLYTGAFKPMFDKEIYIGAIEYIRDHAINKEIRKISIKALKEIRFMCKGYDCPNIEGKDMEGLEIKTKDYKGKYLYMMFFDRFSRMMAADLTTVSEIGDTKDYLHIAIICDERQREEKIRFLKKYNLDDNAVFCEHYSELKAKFKVIVAPSYFFVDKKGKIIQAHTIKPNQKFMKTLNQIDIKEIRHRKPVKNPYFN